MRRLSALPIRLLHLLPGLACCALLAGLAQFGGGFAALAAHGLGALTLAILLGLLGGNLLPGRWHAPLGAGVAFARHWLLRAGVVLYGLRLSVQDIAALGTATLLLDVLMLLSTFLLACWLGRRWLNLETASCLLIGIGSAVCGAAAIMAAEPVIRARSEQVTVAVASVVLFGTLATLLYPLLYPLSGALLGDAGFARYVGASVHEVAQVLATAHSIGTPLVDTALLTKMLRVLLLAPFLLLLSFWLSRRNPAADGVKSAVKLPGFALAFLAAVLLNSVMTLPAALAQGLQQADGVLLGMAMAALGFASRLRVLLRAGSKPFVLALLLFVWLVLGGFLLCALLASL